MDRIIIKVLREMYRVFRFFRHSANICHEKALIDKLTLKVKASQGCEKKLQFKIRLHFYANSVLFFRVFKICLHIVCQSTILIVISISNHNLIYVRIDHVIQSEIQFHATQDATQKPVRPPPSQKTVIYGSNRTSVMSKPPLFGAGLILLPNGLWLSREFGDMSITPLAAPVDTRSLCLPLLQCCRISYKYRSVPGWYLDIAS